MTIDCTRVSNRYGTYLLAACLLVILMAGSVMGGDAGARADAPPFTTVVHGNNYSKHTHLQSYDGKTFMVLSTMEHDEPCIWSVDHATGQWRGPVQVGFNQIPPADQHGNPSMVVDDDGYIHVWFGSHGGRDSRRVYARSKRPADITEWIYPPFDPQQTYPQPCVTSDGTVYVFYRNGGHGMPGSARWLFRRSRDNGLTWSDPIVAVRKMSGSGTADLYCVPTLYPDGRRIGIGISDEFLPGSPTRHSTSHLFYVVFDTETGKLRNIKGRELDAPDGLTIGMLRKHCMVADYDAMENYNKRVSARPCITTSGIVHLLAPNGNPAAFAPRPTDFNPDEPLKMYEDGGIGHPPNYGELTYTGRPRIYWWNGNEWAHADPETKLTNWLTARKDILVSWRKTRAGEFERIESRNHGYTWKETDTVKVPAREGKHLKALFHTAHRQPHGSAQVLFYERTSPRAGDGRAWLWGDEGFLAPPQPLSQATIPIGAWFDSMADRIRFAERSTPGEPPYILPITNPFGRPLQLSMSELQDTAPGWTLEIPDVTRIAPGETARLTFAAKAPKESARYPLPVIKLQIEMADGEHRPFTSIQLLPLPLVGAQPDLRIVRTTTEPTLDGELNEEAWPEAPTVPALGRMDGTRSIEPATQVRATCDAEALYVAFRCHEPKTDQLRSEYEQRDGKLWLDDSVEIMLDPTGDGTDYYQLIVNTDGAIFDGCKLDQTVNLDNVRVSTSVADDHWTAEIAIPWKDVGLDGPPEDAGILFCRNRHVTGEHQVFQFPVSPDGNHQPGNFSKVRFDGE